VRARMTAMRHQVNVRKNAGESDTVKDKERKRNEGRKGFSVIHPSPYLSGEERST